MRKEAWFALGLALASCTDDAAAPPATTELTLVLPTVPAGINCIDVAFRDQDDVVTHRQAVLPRNGRVAFDGVHLGAYEVSARAYAAGDCAQVPGDAPWGTSGATVLILTEQSPASLTLFLVETRPVDIIARFVESETVVAQDQGPLAGIAAAGNHVAWVVPETAAGVGTSAAPGRIVQLFDDDDTTQPPEVRVPNAVRPQDITVAADGRIFWVQAHLPGQPAAGAIWRFTPFVGADVIASGQRNSEITYAASADIVYWADVFRIWAVGASTPGATPFVLSEEPGANNITILRGDQWPYEVLWGRYDDGLVRRYQPYSIDTAATSGLLPPNDGIIGSAADDAAAYVTTYGDSDGLGAIYRVATDGSNAVQQLTPRGAITWPVEAMGGFVYYAGAGALGRVPADGSGAPETLATGEIASFALTSWGGRNWIYWLDNRFGGVVWRARLE